MIAVGQVVVVVMLDDGGESHHAFVVTDQGQGAEIGNGEIGVKGWHGHLVRFGHFGGAAFNLGGE